jgi:hypothetical protein
MNLVKYRISNISSIRGVCQKYRVEGMNPLLDYFVFWNWFQLTHKNIQVTFIIFSFIICVFVCPWFQCHEEHHCPAHAAVEAGAHAQWIARTVSITDVTVLTQSCHCQPTPRPACTVFVHCVPCFCPYI